MAHATTFSTLAALALVGAGTGVHLGRSAISQINPLYYSPLNTTKSYAALTPHRSVEGTSSAARLAAIEDAAALGDGCVGCATYPEEYFPQRDGLEDGYSASAWSSRNEEPAAVEYAAYQEAPAAPDPAREDIERYSSYPVAAEVEEPKIAAAPEVAVEEVQATY